MVRTISSCSSTSGISVNEMKSLSINILLALFLSAAVQAGDYGLDPAGKTDSLDFRSTARLEFIKGETQDLIGGFQFNFEQPAEPVTGLLRVDLRMLKTGIETRDGHMRDNQLHTDQFPYAYFELQSVNNMPQTVHPDSIYEVTGQGYFHIHGIKRVISPDLTFKTSNNPDGTTSVWVKAEFALRLDDFKIPRPKALFLKLAEVIEVTVVFTGHSYVKITPIDLPDWDELP